MANLNNFLPSSSFLHILRATTILPSNTYRHLRVPTSSAEPHLPNPRRHPNRNVPEVALQIGVFSLDPCSEEVGSASDVSVYKMH